MLVALACGLLVSIDAHTYMSLQSDRSSASCRAQQHLILACLSTATAFLFLYNQARQTPCSLLTKKAPQ